VRAADRQCQQHRVQADEGSGPARRLTEAGGRPRDQRHRAEARGDSDRFQRPQAAGQTERNGHIAREREQGAVGGVLKRPSDEREGRVGGSFGGHVRVGVQAVQDAHPRERQIAEGVLGEQRRPEQQDHVRQHDRRGDRAHRQRARGDQHEHVARAHDQRQRLEAVFAEGRSQILQRPGHPPRPSAAAGGDEFRGIRGRVGAQQQHGRDHAQQAERAQRTRDAGRRPCAGAPFRLRPWACRDPDVWYRGRGLYALHCCACPDMHADMHASSAPASL
jgi:hypothetical protein